MREDVRQLLTQVRATVAVSNPEPKQCDYYICHHIRDARRANPALTPAADYMLDYIRTQLDDCWNLEVWQRYEGRQSLSKGVIADRLAWIDWMLGDK
jgi:hypothetical protein